MGGARQQKKSGGGSKKKGGHGHGHGHGHGSRGGGQQAAGQAAGRDDDMSPTELEPEPEPEMGAASGDAAGDEMGLAKDGRQHFRVINRAFVRGDFEMGSAREGTVEVGEEIEALEMRHNENGVLRVRFSRGWVSSHGPDGSTILERTAAVSSRQLEARESLLSGKRPAGGSPPGEASAGMAELPDEEPTVYRVLNRAFIRGGFELDSRRQGTVEPGEEIVALELRDNQDGVTRVRFERGWVSATGPDGTSILTEVNANVPPQHGLLETALTEGLLDADGRPKPLPAQAARAPQLSQYALLHVDDNEGGGCAALNGPKMEAAPAISPARGTWPTIPTMDGAPAGAMAAPLEASGVLGCDTSGISSKAMQSQPDGSGPPRLPHGEIGGIWDGLMLGSGGGGSAGLASLAEVPRVSAAELVPDSACLTEDPNAVVRSIGLAQLEALREALEEQRAALGAGGGGGSGTSSSKLEEYTHENPAYPNPLEFALCRRESPGVMRALCAAFPTKASELLPGGQEQLPLHAACVSGGNWLVPPSFSFGGSADGDGEDGDGEDCGEKIDDSAAEVVSILLQAHPPAAKRADASGCYPLHLAARHSPSPKVVETLLAEYAEAAGKPDKAGNLPLHLAFLRPLFKPALAQTVQLLIEAHPEGLDACDGEGRTPAEVGKSTGAAEDVLALVRRAEFMAGATQSLLG